LPPLRIHSVHVLLHAAAEGTARLATRIARLVIIAALGTLNTQTER
jgi:hypothetical protein